MWGAKRHIKYKSGTLVVTEAHLLLSDFQPSKSHPSTRGAETGLREFPHVQIHTSPKTRTASMTRMLLSSKPWHIYHALNVSGPVKFANLWVVYSHAYSLWYCSSAPRVFIFLLHYRYCIKNSKLHMHSWLSWDLDWDLSANLVLLGNASLMANTHVG